MSDYLLTGAITNSVNVPSISAEEAPKLTPFAELAQQLGSFAGQLTEEGITEVTLEYEGDVANMNTRVLTNAALTGLLKPQLEDVNTVSAPVIAKERGIQVAEVKREQRGAYETYIRLTVKTGTRERSVAGTVFSDGRPRLIQIKGVNMEAALGHHMLYVTNQDKPGFIGALGSILGKNAINIANFNLGREAAGGDAICLIEVDADVPAAILKEIQALPHVVQAKTLSF
ncbi:MAG TPA: ACT domain-containing protein [Pseudorhodoferax sp.]|nr:ACT domain-containing protein [Pseudorhodoferax sp.]